MKDIQNDIFAFVSVIAEEVKAGEKNNDAMLEYEEKLIDISYRIDNIRKDIESDVARAMAIQEKYNIPTVSWEQFHNHSIENAPEEYYKVRSEITRKNLKLRKMQLDYDNIRMSQKECRQRITKELLNNYHVTERDIQDLFCKLIVKRLK